MRFFFPLFSLENHKLVLFIFNISISILIFLFFIFYFYFWPFIKVLFIFNFIFNLNMSYVCLISLDWLMLLFLLFFLLILSFHMLIGWKLNNIFFHAWKKVFSRVVILASLFLIFLYVYYCCIFFYNLIKIKHTYFTVKIITRVINFLKK